MTTLKRALIGLVAGVPLTALVSAVDLAVTEFGHNSYVPGPNVSFGFPWDFGVYDDTSKTLTVLYYHSQPRDDYYPPDSWEYWGLFGDLLVFTGLSFGAVLFVAKRRS